MESLIKYKFEKDPNNQLKNYNISLVTDDSTLNHQYKSILINNKCTLLLSANNLPLAKITKAHFFAKNEFKISLVDPASKLSDLKFQLKLKSNEAYHAEIIICPSHEAAIYYYWTFYTDKWILNCSLKPEATIGTFSRENGDFKLFFNIPKELHILIFSTLGFLLLRGV
ncbi:hypothetical protein K502DRAFT_349442 [Neoconidiobolus thromboides FSU 785]|nr:hypothetical protein K502DRAFT_349442 [Neoconidiobolus thromboides FSU 785]